MYLSFGEQVKIVLKRKGMTIKELAEIMEARTGKKMSRQNLTQKLGRDNFQEKDMRLIAEILECSLQLNMLDEEAQMDEAVISKVKDKIQRKKEKAKNKAKQTKEEKSEKIEVVEEVTEQEEKEGGSDLENVSKERTSTEYLPDMREVLEENVEKRKSEQIKTETPEETLTKEKKSEEKKPEEKKVSGWRSYFGKLNRKLQGEETKKVEEAKRVAEPKVEPANEEEAPSKYPEQYHRAYEEARDEMLAVTEEEDLEKGDRNPYTGREYESNSVRIHPSRIGYVQVYSRKTHSWKDMTEWAFLGEQERLKAELGKEYQEPIYLD